MVRGSNPSVDEIFHTCPDRPWATQLLVQWVLSLSWGKEWPGRDAGPHSLLVPWSRKSRTKPLHPCGPYGLYRAPVPVQGCTLPLPFLKRMLFYVSGLANKASHVLSFCRDSGRTKRFLCDTWH